MGRLLVFFQPVEILDFSPIVGSIFPFKLLDIVQSIRVVVGVWGEYDSVTVFNNGFAGDEYLKSGIVGIMDS